MKLSVLLTAALLSLGALFPAAAAPSAQAPVMQPCEGLQGENARDCQAAMELLTRKPEGLPETDFSILASRSADGWHYRLPGSEDAAAQTCPDDGPLTLPAAASVELLLTGEDAAYEWKVPALGLDVALLPGRLESIVTAVNEPGLYAGELASLSGMQLEAADGSLRVVEQAAFDAWKAAAFARKC